jgi:hypothetical protein
VMAKRIRIGATAALSARSSRMQSLRWATGMDE